MSFSKLFCLLLLIVCAVAETHFLFNRELGSIDAVLDSPFQLRQPHSLPDFMYQVEWIQELSEIRAFIKGKQVHIDKRFDEDDPEIEKKLRETDEDCVRSRSMELKTEHFVSAYPIDLMPFFSRGELIYSTKETLKIGYLKEFLKIDETNFDTSLGEPECHDSPDSNKKIDKLFPEQQLALLSEEEIRQLGRIIQANLLKGDDESRDLALYYANFYWRLRGDKMMALNCLTFYLKRHSDSVPAILQTGLIQLQFGNYASAIKHLQYANDRITSNLAAECLEPLGDAFVLDGDFPSAIKIYDQIYRIEPNKEDALKKSSLLKCTNKLFEVLENQHKNLWEINKDAESFREKMHRMQELETLIEKNRAPPEARLQARLAHEHYEFDHLPYAYCRDGNQWASGGRERKRLYCTVNSWSKYEEAVEQRKKERRAERMDKLMKRTEEQKDDQTMEEIGRFGNEELAEYLDKLKPFVGMMIDEPQTKPKYPIENKSLAFEHFYHENWPSLTECRKSLASGKLWEEQSHQQLFISPQNKGFMLSELSKYLALDHNQLTPLPWNLPYCQAITDEGVLTDKLRFIVQLNGIKRLKSDELNTKILAESTLKQELYKMVDFDFDAIDKPSKGEPLLGEIGQRIVNLIKFGIGPKWMSLNLAALFFRILGLPSESVKCLELALNYPQYLDITLTQMAQLLLRIIENQKDIEGIERILSIAMQEGIYEPIPYHLMGILRLRQNHSMLAERLFRQALELDPQFEPSMRELLRMKCLKRVHARVPQIREAYSPVCCWPNEQNIICFKQKTKTSGRTRTRCFRLETSFDEPFHVQYVYFRCNTPYTGRSYPPPSFALLLGPLLLPADELRQMKRQRFIQKMEAEELIRAEKADKTIQPILPLDYGGYSEERIKAHLHPVWPEGLDPENMQQTLNFVGDEESFSKTENKGGAEEKQKLIRLIRIDASEIAELKNRSQVVDKLDIPLPEVLPVPPEYLVEKGKQFSHSIELNKLSEICKSQRKSSVLLEQPVSSWVSVTAKGIKVEDLVDLHSPVTSIEKLEPECPEPALALERNSILLELDYLPAYQYRYHLTKFYKPETALRNTLRSFGEPGGLVQIEHVAARLYFALKGAHSADKVHWALGTLSTLYWRVKGDPVNAIKCLRHSLYNSPDKFKDVPLISLANIYHQAGFLHSALVVGTKALPTGVDVVALHFTMANIYASMGDFQHALQFYLSTLALQSNFEPAKSRIMAVHCVTNGILLDK